jgi:hypothetical protein
VNPRARRIASTILTCSALAMALVACEGTSSDGDADGGNAGTNGMAGATGGSGNGGGGSSGGQGGASGSSGGQGGAGNGGGGGASGSGGAGSGGAGNGGQGGAGAMDASTDPDAERDAGSLPSDCSGGGYLICEDFEDTALGAVPDGWSKFGDPVGVADDQAASGTKSLKMSQSDEWRRMQRDATSLPTTHWGRMRYRVATPVPEEFVHSTLVSFSGQSPDDGDNLDVRVVDTVKEQADGFDGMGNGNRHQFLYNVQPQNRGEFGRGSSYDWRFDGQWHCVEWYVDSAEQAYRFFFDGDEVEEIALHNGPGVFNGPHTDPNEDDHTDIPSSWGELRVGWTNYQSAGEGFTAWIDDFAIAEQRVTCD